MAALLILRTHDHALQGSGPRSWLVVNNWSVLLMPTGDRTAMGMDLVVWTYFIAENEDAAPVR
jgi:hypothetical protein